VSVERYLEELARHLHAWPLRRRRILAEVRAHLQDAGEGGVERFGEPAAVAARFNAVHPPPPARLTAVAVLVSAWLVFGAVQGLEGQFRPAPWPEGGAPGMIEDLLTYATFAILAAVAPALVTLVAPRALRPGLALAAAGMVTVCAALLVWHAVERAEHVPAQPAGWWAAALALVVLSPTLGAAGVTLRMSLRRSS